jgi:hypothetical protein
MMKKICFVIMGFGKKLDYKSGKTYDLDKSYNNIIKPVVEELNYICVRSDEISYSGYIEKPMYSLLIHADLVIADISTFNPNAIYELGIRHASKPYKTIIISEDSIVDGYHPFDLSHISTLMYKHLGEDIGFDETLRIREQLKDKIQKNMEITDSPLFTFLSDMEVHQLSEKERSEIVSLIASDEVFISKKIKDAKLMMDSDRFTEAFFIWKELNEKVPNEIYYVQQMALSKYKSQFPNKRDALEDAKIIINSILLDNNDPETLGIAGAINKKIYLLNNDKYVLKQAIEYYEKGYKLNRNYYNGENYAMCTELMYMIEENVEEKIHYKVLSRKIREEVLEISTNLEYELDQMNDKDKWLYATVANNYFYFDQLDEYNEYRSKFMQFPNAKWEIDTFEDGINHVKEYNKKVK